MHEDLRTDGLRLQEYAPPPLPTHAHAHTCAPAYGAAVPLWASGPPAPSLASKEKDRLHFARSLNKGPTRAPRPQWGLAVCWQWNRGAGTGTGTKTKRHIFRKQAGDASGCLPQAHAAAARRSALGAALRRQPHARGSAPARHGPRGGGPCRLKERAAADPPHTCARAPEAPRAPHPGSCFLRFLPVSQFLLEHAPRVWRAAT